MGRANLWPFLYIMKQDATQMLDQPGDKALRSRVRLLGSLLGEVLAEQAGENVLATVESLRKGYIKLRKEENPRLRARLTRLINGLDPETLTHVIRGYNIYFSLVNIAEEAFQHEQRRRQARKKKRLWTGSFTRTFQERKPSSTSKDAARHAKRNASGPALSPAHSRNLKNAASAWTSFIHYWTRRYTCRFLPPIQQKRCGVP